MKRSQRFGLLASPVWVVAAALLASRNETWLAAWKRYCALTTDPTCADDVVLVVHWGAIVGIVLYPLILIWLVALGLVALRRRIQQSGHGA